MDKWFQILKELTAPNISPKLEYRIYEQILIKGQQYTKEKEADFQEGSKLLAKLMVAQADYNEKHGIFGDMFGDFMIQNETTNSRAGQFFTPAPLTDLIAAMTLTELSDMLGDPKYICDPAAGTGRFMLATAKRYAQTTTLKKTKLSCPDIDFSVYVFCTTNAILQKIPSFNVWGDSLMMEYREAIAVIPGILLEWHSVSKERITEIMNQSIIKKQTVTAQNPVVIEAPVISGKKKKQATLL